MIAVQEKENKEPEKSYSHSGCGTYHRGVNPDWITWAENELARLTDAPIMHVDYDPGCDVYACQFNPAWVEWAEKEIARLHNLKS